MDYDRVIFLAQLAADAYGHKIHRNGYTCDFLDIQSNQLYILENTTEQIIVFRGTDEFVDWLVDLNYFTTNNIHRGFYNYASNAYRFLQNAIHHHKKLTLVGHSLGGAVALAFADFIDHPDVEIYTFGCPRTGTKHFTKRIKYAHHRFVTYLDHAPLTPVYPYKHHGTLYYLTPDGNIHINPSFLSQHYLTKGIRIKNHNMRSYISLLIQSRTYMHITNYNDNTDKQL
jgi:hypothetical protein